MKTENRLYNFRLFFLVLIAIFLQLFNFKLKEIYHMDEIFSYGLANSENGVYLYNDASEIDNKLLKGEFFENHLIQQGNSSFSQMWDNLKYDNHMPLFFILQGDGDAAKKGFARLNRRDGGRNYGNFRHRVRYESAFESGRKTAWLPKR